MASEIESTDEMFPRDRCALDQFLSEGVLERVSAAAHDNARVHPQAAVEPLEVILDPIEVICQEPKVTMASPVTPEPSSRVQVWPMLAAALVALGVATLALAVFAKYAHV